MDVTIENFYEDQTIFLTGGTGFLGKVVLEKLLRSCPNVGKIYFLCRPKKNFDIRDRIKTMCDEEMFDMLKQTSNDWQNKIVPIRGDIAELGLGLTREDEERLKNDVNVIIHAAAAVEFNSTFKNSLLINTRGTREVCNLALKMPNLKFFLHVSTAYSNSNRRIIDETLYPVSLNWSDSIKCAEEMDPYDFEVIASKFIGDHVNYYTYTKSLSEHVVNDLCVKNVPTFIIRPAIVIPSIEEPKPGWIDNFNGPIAMFIASGKGLIRTVYIKESRLDYVPVDYVSRVTLLIPFYHLNVLKMEKKSDELVIYNVCGAIKPDMQSSSLNLEVSRIMPLEKTFGYPTVTYTKSKLYYYVCVVLYQLIPSLFVDLLLRMFGKKPFMLRLQAKFFINYELIIPIVLDNWTFKHKNFDRLKCYVDENVIKGYELIEHNFLTEKHLKKFIYGAKKYLLKEKMNTEDDIRYQEKMKLLHYGLKLCQWMLIMYLLRVTIFSALF